MQTVQRNFVASLSASGVSPKRQFTAVKNFVKKAPKVEKIGSCIVEHIELPLELTPDGSRNVLIAAKSTDPRGVVTYTVGEAIQSKQ